MNARQAIEALGFDLKNMTPNYQAKIGDRSDVVAWQYLRTNPVPIWVFRNFHNLDVGSQYPTLTHRSGHKVKLNEWIVSIPEEKICLILTDEEFQELFTPLPFKKEGAE